MIEELAKRTDNAELYLNLARNFLLHHEWGRAKAAAKNALESTGPSSTAEAAALLAKIDECLFEPTAGNYTLD